MNYDEYRAMSVEEQDKFDAYRSISDDDMRRIEDWWKRWCCGHKYAADPKWRARHAVQQLEIVGSDRRIKYMMERDGITIEEAVKKHNDSLGYMRVFHEP